jgi:type VI secretion system protein ImpC
MSTTNTAAAAAGQSVEQTTAEPTLLDQIVSQGRFNRDAATLERGRDMVKEFVSQVLEGHMTLTRDAEATIQTRIAQIDHLISLQLNEVLHYPAFQKLEGTWRGLKYLLDQSETSDMLKIKVLNVSKREVLKDLQRASEFDQSALFKKVYEEEFGVFGGAPFASIVGDFEFGRGPEDMELLERISQVASAAHAPFLTAASSEQLYAAWRTTRHRQNFRFDGICQVEVIPSIGRFPLRCPDSTAYSYATPIRERYKDNRCVRLRGSGRWQRSLEVSVGQCCVGSGRKAH